MSSASIYWECTLYPEEKDKRPNFYTCNNSHNEVMEHVGQWHVISIGNDMIYDDQLQSLLTFNIENFQLVLSKYHGIFRCYELILCLPRISHEWDPILNKKVKRKKLNNSGLGLASTDSVVE